MIYNYKSDEIVQDIITDDLSPVIEDIETEFTKLRRGEHICIFAPSYIARDILSNLLENLDDVFVHSESHNELLYSDKNDICLTLSYDDCIFIENARWDDKYLTRCNGAMNYVYDNFKKSDIDKMSLDENPILVFGLKEEPVEKIIRSHDKNGYHVTIKNVTTPRAITYDKYIWLCIGRKEEINCPKRV